MVCDIMKNSILENFYKNLEQFDTNKPRALAIGIYDDELPIKLILDEKPYNHATAFNHIAENLNLIPFDTISPMEAGNNLADQGVLAIQIRDSIGIIYFPTNISDLQYDYLEQELLDYENFGYQFKECENQEIFVDKSVVLEYAKLITKTKKK